MQFSRLRPNYTWTWSNLLGQYFFSIPNLIWSNLFVCFFWLDWVRSNSRSWLTDLIGLGWGRSDRCGHLGFGPTDPFSPLITRASGIHGDLLASRPDKILPTLPVEEGRNASVHPSTLLLPLRWLKSSASRWVTQKTSCSLAYKYYFFSPSIHIRFFFHIKNISYPVDSIWFGFNPLWISLSRS